MNKTIGPMQDQPEEGNPIRLDGCGCSAKLHVVPAEITVTSETANGTRVTLREVPCGVCARCGAPFFRSSVDHAIESICGLFKRTDLGHIERSYKDLVRRYWVHP